MKFFHGAVLLVCITVITLFHDICVSSTPLTSLQIQILYTKYISDYNKQYEINDIYDRLNIFTRNLNMIIAHNQTPNVTWKMGINQFTDMTNYEYNQLLNIYNHIESNNTSYSIINTPSHINKESLVDNSSFNNNNMSKISSSDKRYINWYKRGKIPPVLDQGPCASSWSFTAISLLESHIAIKNNKKPELYSQQQLIDCNTYSKGCGGGTISSAFDYILNGNNGNNKKICSSSQYAYTARDEICLDKKCNIDTHLIDYNIIKHDNTGHYIHTLNSNKLLHISSQSSYVSSLNDSIYIDLLQYGPIGITLSASSTSFQFYDSGILTSCSQDTPLNHSLLLVGYDIDHDTGIEYYLLKNSYGLAWGDKGYIKIQAHKSLCGMMTSQNDVQPIIG